jgi:hypothetical protein
MRVAILAESNIVVVDGDARSCDCAELVVQQISAVQWDGEKGHVEFAGHYKLNEDIADFAPFQPYLDQGTRLADRIANEVQSQKLLALCKGTPPS